MKSMKEYVRSIEPTINKHGRFNQGVIGDDGEPPFLYTIGNARKNLPEILIIGGANRSFSTIANFVSEMMIQRGREFSDGESVGIGGAVDMRAIVATPEAKNYTLIATTFYGHDDYRVTQIILPDPDGRFPGEPDCARPFCLIPVLRRS